MSPLLVSNNPPPSTRQQFELATFISSHSSIDSDETSENLTTYIFSNNEIQTKEFSPKFLDKRELLEDDRVSKETLKNALYNLLRLFKDVPASKLVENLTPSQLRADDSPELTSTLALHLYEKTREYRKDKAREVIEWELAYAGARQRYTAYIRALLNLCILARTEKIELDTKKAFEEVQKILNELKQRLLNTNTENNRVLLAEKLLESEYLIEKGLYFRSANMVEQVQSCFKEALEPSIFGAEFGFNKWLLVSLKWTAISRLEAKRWLEAATYFGDYCSRCLYHLRQMFLDHNTTLLHFTSPTGNPKQESRSQLKYFIPGSLTESFINLSDCLFHLGLLEEASVCISYISPVVISVNNEELTARHFELKMNINDGLSRRRNKGGFSEDEDWDSEFGSNESEGLVKKFPALFNDKLLQSHKQMEHKLNFLKDELGIVGMMQKTCPVAQYPKPTVLYSVRLADGRMHWEEREYEYWLMHYCVIHDSKYLIDNEDNFQKCDSSFSRTILPNTDDILDRLKRLDQVTVEWAEMYLLLFWTTCRDKNASLIWKYSESYFSSLQSTSSHFTDIGWRDEQQVQSLFQMSMEILEILRTVLSLEYFSIRISQFYKAIGVVENVFSSMNFWTKLYRIQCKAHFCLNDDPTGAVILQIVNDLLKLASEFSNDSCVAAATHWKDINFDIAFPSNPSLQMLECQMETIITLYLFLCQRSPLTGKQRGGWIDVFNGEVIPRREDLQSLMKKLKVQYECLPLVSVVKARAAFVLAHYGIHSTGDKTSAERQLLESLLIYKNYAQKYFIFPGPILMKELIQQILNSFSEILVQNGKAIYGLAVTKAESAAYYTINREHSLALLLTGSKLSHQSGLFSLSIAYLYQVLNLELDKGAQSEVLTLINSTADSCLEFGYFSLALEVLQCGVTYIQESTAAQNVSTRRDTFGKGISKTEIGVEQLFSWRLKRLIAFQLKIGIVFTASHCFDSAEKFFRSILSQSQDSRMNTLALIYMAKIHYGCERYEKCLSVCERLEQLSSFTIGELMEKAKISFRVVEWDLELKVSQLARFLKIRCFIQRYLFLEALRSTDFVFLDFSACHLRQLGYLYYLRGKILCKIYIHSKGDLVIRSTGYSISCLVRDVRQMVGPRTLQIISKGAESFERTVNWSFDAMNEEDLIKQALDSLFRSINYFKKTSQEFQVAKAHLYIGKVINSYLIRHLPLESPMTVDKFEQTGKAYLEKLAGNDLSEILQLDRMLIGANKTWKHLGRLWELLHGYVSLAEFYSLTGNHLGASFLFRECWLSLMDLFAVDSKYACCTKLKSAKLIRKVMDILSEMIWMMITFFTEEEICQYLLVFDAVHNCHERLSQLYSNISESGVDAAEQKYIDGIQQTLSKMRKSKGVDTSTREEECFDQCSLDSQQGNEQEVNLELEVTRELEDHILQILRSEEHLKGPRDRFARPFAHSRRSSTFQYPKRTIYEVGQVTKEQLTNPNGLLQKLWKRCMLYYPLDVTKLTIEQLQTELSYSSFQQTPIRELQCPWEVYYHLQWLKTQWNKGRLEYMEEWRRDNWNCWMRWRQYMRKVRCQYPVITTIPKRLTNLSLFIYYYDHFVLIYAPSGQTRHSIPLYEKQKKDSNESSESYGPLGFELKRYLKRLLPECSKNAKRSSHCWFNKDLDRNSEQAKEISEKHLLTSTLLASLNHTNQLNRLLLFVDPSISFVPWESFLQIPMVRCHSLYRLLSLWILYSPAKREMRSALGWKTSQLVAFEESLQTVHHNVGWFSFTSWKKERQQIAQMLHSLVNSHLNRLYSENMVEKDSCPMSSTGPLPYSFWYDSSTTINRKRYHASKQTIGTCPHSLISIANLLQANALLLQKHFLRFSSSCEDTESTVHSFLFTHVDMLPEAWTTLNMFLENCHQAMGFFVPLKYIQQFLSLVEPIFNQSNSNDISLGHWVRQILQLAQQNDIPLSIYLTADTIIKHFI